MNKKTEITALKSGDQQAFRAVMHKYYDRLFNFSKGYLHDNDAAMEIVQETFIRLWEKRQRIATTTNLQAYLFTISRNLCLDHIKHRKIELQFEKEASHHYLRLSASFHALLDNSLDILMAKDLEKAINEAIDLLPEQCRKVFLLSRKEGLKNRQIAQKLKLSEKTVESHISKALRDVRSFLSKHYPELLCLEIAVNHLLISGW